MGGEWNEHCESVEAHGKNEKKLAKEVDRLTKEHTFEGRRIDFGFIDGTAKVEWEKQVFNVTKHK